jgi:hypothetical protein
MGVLRWVLIVWSAVSLLIFLVQALLVPQVFARPAQAALLALSVLFYILNLVFLWRVRPNQVSKLAPLSRLG